MQAERSCASIEAPAARSQVSSEKDKENDSMSVKLATHENGDVIVVDPGLGRIALPERRHREIGQCPYQGDARAPPQPHLAVSLHIVELHPSEELTARRER